MYMVYIWFKSGLYMVKIFPSTNPLIHGSNIGDGLIQDDGLPPGWVWNPMERIASQWIPLENHRKTTRN